MFSEMALLDSVDDKAFEITFSICLCLYIFLLLWSNWMHVIIVCIMYACLREIRKRKRIWLESSSKAVLITGCDTGFGYHLAKRLDDHGFTVFAGVLSDSSAGANTLRARNSKRLQVVQLDVTRDSEVMDAIKLIQSKCKEKGLWGLVNNAGFTISGDVEFATIEQYKKCHEVNLYGMIRVTKACLPYIRKAKGRIVNTSSVKGRYAWPSDSIYHVSKYGVETFSDSLRMEMRKFDVKVAIIEPGYFDGATSMCSEKQMARLKRELDASWEAATEDARNAYGREHINSIYAALSCESIPVSSPDPVLNAIEDALLSKSPRPRYLVFGNSGWFVDQYALLGSTYHFLPTWLTDFIIARMTGCDRTFTNKSKGD